MLVSDASPGGVDMFGYRTLRVKHSKFTLEALFHGKFNVLVRV